MVFQFNDNREFHVMGSPTLFAVDLVFLQFPDGLDFNLSNTNFEVPLWNKYDKNWMIATMSLCKSILSDDGVLVVFSAIDMQTKKVLNSTLHNGNMKVLRTFICLNSYMVFKDPESPTYTVSITHHNSFYVHYLILVLFILYIVLTQFVFLIDSCIYGSCFGKGFYHHKIHKTTKIHVFWDWLEKQKLAFQFCG